MDRGAWWAAVHGVAKSRTRLSDFTFTFLHWRRKWQPTPVFLPGEAQGRGSLVGCCLWGRIESDTTEGLSSSSSSSSSMVGCCLWGRIESDTTEGLSSSSSSRTSQVAQTAKRLPIVRETWVRSLSREDPLEKWQPTPAFLPGKIPWMEEPGGLQSGESQRVGHN